MHDFPRRFLSGLIERKPMRGVRQGCYTLLVLSLLILPAFQSVQANNAGTSPMRVIELYTSHGCSSCPPADKLLGELLAEDDELVALEFHVDYWNTLIHGNDGNFVDPFSSASHSQRQRLYNAGGLHGRPGVYTPQAIINGRVATVGSNRSDIIKALSKPVQSELDIVISPDALHNRLTVVVSGAEPQRRLLSGSSVLLFRYLDKVETDITGGENKGKTLINHHVVEASTLLGEITEDGAITFDFDAPSEGEGCVVLVQGEALSPVHAAAVCP